MALIHDIKYDELKKIFINGKVKKWDLDENALGAFAFLKPHQFSQIFHDLRAKEGRLFFAGEHTDSPHAWIDTAIKSGVRAAKEVVEVAGCF